MVYWLSRNGPTVENEQRNVPVTPPVTPPQPPWPTRGARYCPLKRVSLRLRMLTATGSICAAVRPNAGASRAADVVPSELVGNACTVGDVLEPFGSMPLRARTPW